MLKLILAFSPLMLIYLLVAGGISAWFSNPPIFLVASLAPFVLAGSAIAITFILAWWMHYVLVW